MFLRTCVFVCTRRVRFEIRTTQGVSPPRLTPSEWGKKHTIVSSSHHEFSNDNGRRQVSCIPLSSSCQYYFYPRIFLSHSRKEFMCEKNYCVFVVWELISSNACERKNIYYCSSRQKMISYNIGRWLEKSPDYKLRL